MKNYFLLCCLMTVALSQVCQAQLSISGPACVASGTIYQYNITGTWQAGDNAEVCLNGGTFADGSTQCKLDSVFSFVRVNWNENASIGSITLNSSSGNATHHVTVSKPMDPGAITNHSQQELEYGNIPLTIECSLPAGGSCNPSYLFQWESSPDGATWTALDGENGQDLHFNTPVLKTTYYRRRIKENSSSEIGYSESAVVYVGADPAGHL